MNVNGISGYSQLDVYSTYANTGKETTSSETASSQDADTAVVYEKTADADIVEMLKNDAAAREQSLMNMVQAAISGQGNALAQTDSVWSFLASGNFTVTEDVQQEAQESISEGGYWSVENTSDRIIEMAKALTGGDSDLIEEMRSAFEKGFQQATGLWGDTLPDISSSTYDAVMEKFDQWAEESQTQI
ncbi:MAG TPA: hypothetical protein PLU43_06140 [Lachnospiraceae bacterium]|nr:hypothetical protein [Lachnospiraceae bacterium]